MGQSLSENNRKIESFGAAMKSGNMVIVVLVLTLPLKQEQMENIGHNFPSRPSRVWGSNRIT